MAIEDLPDGRTHLIHTVRDLRCWLDRSGAVTAHARCSDLRPVRQAPRHHDVDGELLVSCIGCSSEVVIIATEQLLEEEA